MQAFNGYIKIYRKFVRWGWYKNSVVKDTFLHCLVMANFTDQSFEGTIIKKGQFVTSYENLASDLGFTTQKVRTAIKKLKSTGEITTKSTNKFTIITVVNWEFYQGMEEIPTSETTRALTNEQQTTNNQITNKQQTTNNKLRIIRKKEYKEYKECKEDILSICIDSFNSKCKSFSKVVKLTDKRKTAISELYHKGIDFDKLFDMAESSDFLSGRNGKWTGCSFDWLMKYDNAIKVIEGTYDNKIVESEHQKTNNCVPTPKATSFNNFAPNSGIDYKKLEMDALKKQLERIKK